jgi:ABC-2 type transport system ATP-binding protein
VLFLGGGRLILSSPVDTIRDEQGKSVDTLFREVFRC